jgi:hypothetical protein
VGARVVPGEVKTGAAEVSGADGDAADESGTGITVAVLISTDVYTGVVVSFPGLG